MESVNIYPFNVICFFTGMTRISRNNVNQHADMMEINNVDGKYFPCEYCGGFHFKSPQKAG